MAYYAKLLLIWLAALMLGCQPADSPETVIEQKIQQIENGIETKNADDVLDPFYEQFATAKGQDKKWIKRTLAFYMLRHQNIQVLITGLDVEIISPDRATARFNVLLTGGESLLPQQGSIYQVETDWRIEDGEWMLVYAKWQKP